MIRLLLTLLSLNLFQLEAAPFHPTIPVVDMKEFYTDQDNFIQKVREALHHVGFFAVINPDVKDEELQRGYDEVIEFFKEPLDVKMSLYRPETGCQRGFVPSEKAQGNAKIDFKEFLHIGPNNNVWSEDHKTVGLQLEKIYSSLLHHAKELNQAFSLSVYEKESFLEEKCAQADHLLRALHYFKNPEGEPWAAAHTDIDLFTILPMATEEGLQVFHDNEWIDVKVPKGAFIVNGGDMLENLTNGYFKSAKHRVVSKDGETERFSIVFFIHARRDQSVSPLTQFITPENPQAYPDATEWDLLAARLVQLGLADEAIKEYDKQSGLREKVKALVEAGTASESTKKTHECYEKQYADHCGTL